MGKDQQPKHRQAAALRRKRAQRDSYDRILIISEGTKTEKHYFEEIQQKYRLHSANIKVVPSEYGTDPLNVVRFAEDVFLNGHQGLSIARRGFEQVYAVFDRDDHHNYHQAIALSEARNGKYQNDLNKKVEFKAIVSVPCFELWFLLHYTNIQHPMHRDEVLQRLKEYVPGYEKGSQGLFGETEENLAIAKERAQALSESNTRHDDDGPYTEVGSLVDVLISLRKK